MNKPALYSHASDIQKRHAKELSNEYANILEEHSAGKQSLLDVGCGSGDVLIETIIPVLARDFTSITGSDNSPEMVEYLKKYYASLTGVVFKQLNIETNQLPLEFHEQFDRVTSFYCLHWIHNQRKALENIFQILRRNGDCFLVFICSSTVYDAYRVLEKDPRWKNYMKDWEKIITPLLDHPEIEKEYESLLKQVGFIDRKVEVKKKTFAYEGLDHFKENMKAINPFSLPSSKYEEYFDAFCECWTDMGLRKKSSDAEDYTFYMKNKLVVVYARKGE